MALGGLKLVAANITSSSQKVFELIEGFVHHFDHIYMNLPQMDI